MRVLEVCWSRALSLVCDVALKDVIIFPGHMISSWVRQGNLKVLDTNIHIETPKTLNPKPPNLGPLYTRGEGP